MRAPARIAPGRVGEPDACCATRSRPRPRSAGPDLPDHGRQPAVPQAAAEAAHQGGVAFSCSHLRRRTKPGRRKPPCMQAINCSSPQHVKPGQAPASARPSKYRLRQTACASFPQSPSAPTERHDQYVTKSSPCASAVVTRPYRVDPPSELHYVYADHLVLRAWSHERECGIDPRRSTESQVAYPPYGGVCYAPPLWWLDAQSPVQHVVTFRTRSRSSAARPAEFNRPAPDRDDDSLENLIERLPDADSCALSGTGDPATRAYAWRTGFQMRHDRAPRHQPQDRRVRPESHRRRADSLASGM